MRSAIVLELVPDASFMVFGVQRSLGASSSSRIFYWARTPDGRIVSGYDADGRNSVQGILADLEHRTAVSEIMDIVETMALDDTVMAVGGGETPVKYFAVDSDGDVQKFASLDALVETVSPSSGIHP